MRAIWLGLCLPLLGTAKDYPTAEVQLAVRAHRDTGEGHQTGDKLGTREGWQSERKSSSSRRAANTTTESIPHKKASRPGSACLHARCLPVQATASEDTVFLQHLATGLFLGHLLLAGCRRGSRGSRTPSRCLWYQGRHRSRRCSSSGRWQPMAMATTTARNTPKVIRKNLHVITPYFLTR